MKRAETERPLGAKIPPQNLESEQIILGAALLGKDIPEHLLPEYFYRESHKKILRAIREIQSSGVEVDMAVVCNYLAEHNELEEVGGAAYIAALTSVPPIHFDLMSHVNIIINKFALRHIIQSANEVTVLSYDEQFDRNMILAKWQRDLNDLMGIFTSGIATNSDGDFESLMSRLSARDTHLECINETMGGLHDGDIIIVAGRPSMGKTSLTMGFLNQTAFEDDLPVMYFGPQVTREKIISRLLSATCQVRLTDLRRGKVTKEERASLQKVHEKIVNSKNINLVAMPETMSAMRVAGEIRALAKKLEEKDQKLGLVIIENLQQLTWPEKLSSRKDEIDAIHGCLKPLAMDIHIPIVISAQINREVEKRENKRPLPSDIKDSGGIEELADATLLLYRPAYYHEGEPADENGWAEAEIDGYKGGPPGVLKSQFNAFYPSWRDMPE